MKKSIVAMSIALLVMSLGASLAMAAPDTTSTPQGMMSGPMTNSTSGPMMGPGTGSMMTTEQMQTQMQSQQNNGMMTNNIQDMPCFQNRTPSK
jgi:hypothetical protein